MGIFPEFVSDFGASHFSVGEAESVRGYVGEDRAVGTPWCIWHNCVQCG